MKDKREGILLAAMELFREKGFASTRIIDIAEKAGIGKGTVYAYFQSKDEIISYIVREVVRKDYEAFFCRVEEKETAREQLMEYIAGSEKMIDKYGPYAVLFKDQIIDNPNVNSEEVQLLAFEMAEEQYHRVRKIVEKGIARGEISGADSHLPAVFVLTVVGAYMSTKVFEFDGKKCPGTVEISGLKNVGISDMTDFILNGIGNPVYRGK